MSACICSLRCCDWGEQLRVEANHPRQDLRIGAIVLSIALVNLAQLSGIGNDNLVAAGGDQTAHPPRVRSRLKSDPGRRFAALKYSCSVGMGRAQASFG